MPTATVTPTITRQYVIAPIRTLVGTLAISADNYVAGGLPVSFAGKHPAVGKDPINLWMYDLANYQYVYDKTNKKIMIFSGLSTPPSALVEYAQPNVQGADAAVASSDSTDQAAAPTSATYVATAYTVAAGAYVFTNAHNPDVARNVAIVVRNPTGGNLNLYQGTATWTVTGTFRGAAQTEAIAWTATGGNKVIATTKYRWLYGVKPFDTVTAVTVNNICDNALTVSIGLGRLFGYPQDGLLGTSADFIKGTLAGASVAIAAVDTTNKTFDLGAISANAAFAVEYNAKVLGPTASGELAAAAIPTAISSGTIYFEMIVDQF